MALTINRYTAEYVAGVRDFNLRIAEGGWGEYPLPTDLQQFENSKDTPLPWEGWLAVQDGAVRGGYLIRHQQFSFRGEVRKVAFYNLSVSEGVVDPAYSGVSMKMAMTAMAREPLLFALGMGGRDRVLPRFLKALGWDMHDVPFYFRSVRPARVVRNIQTARGTALRRALLDGAAYTGAATVGVHALQWSRSLRGGPIAVLRWDEAAQFEKWADDIWRTLHGSFAMIGVRDSEALNTLYPASHKRLTRLKMLRDNRVIGWAVVMNTQMQNHKQFGNLHVGTLVDGLSAHEDAPSIVKASARFLQERGVDLIVSNQSHEAWCSGLERCGFLRGPSNYLLAVSKGLSRQLSPFEQNMTQVHINRGDGDGPIHL
jgi:hypothetical protein